MLTAVKKVRLCLTKASFATDVPPQVPSLAENIWEGSSANQTTYSKGPQEEESDRSLQRGRKLKRLAVAKRERSWRTSAEKNKDDGGQAGNLTARGRDSDIASEVYVQSD